MSQRIRRICRPRLDCCLVLGLAIVVGTLCHLSLPGAWTLAATLAAVLLYVVLSVRSCGATPSAAAGRGYLLCFFASLCGAAMEGPQILLDYAQLVDSPEVGAVPTDITAAASGLAIRSAATLLAGVILVAASSVFESISSDGGSSGLALLDRMGAWLDRNEGGQALHAFLRETNLQVNGLQSACSELTREVDLTQSQMEKMSGSAETTRQVLNQLSHTSRELATDLQDLTGRVAGIGASVDQLQAAVEQIGHVLDEFSALLSHKILEM